MTIQQIAVIDIQFSQGDEKIRRLADELRKTQRALNTLIQAVNKLAAEEDEDV